MTKFVNTAADIPLIADRPIFSAGEVSAAVAAAKTRRMNFPVLYCHECTAGPEWDSRGRAESDYLHHVNLVTQGSAECVCGDETLRLRPGHAYFFPGNTPLRRICRRGFVSYLLVFRCEWFPGIDFLLDWPDRRPLCLGSFDDREWRRCMASWPDSALATWLQVQSHIGLWVAKACPTLDVIVTRHIECHARFSNVFEYVSQHLSAGLRVSRLARVYGGSLQAFSVAFSRTVGLTPKAFITRQLNERVIHRLVTTDHSLQQIATACGFSDQFQLSRCFRRLNGMAPSDFRRRFFASSHSPLSEATKACRHDEC